mgnify:CR=1 FL=1
MKKLIFVFFLVALSFSVSALGEIKKLEVNKGETVTVDLKVKDGVELNLMGDRHIITVNKIHYKGADLDIFNFVDTEQKTMYITVNKKQSVKLDLDRDGKGEIYIKLNKFYKYDGPNEERLDGVSLDFYYPADEEFPPGQLDQVTGDVVENIGNNEENSEPKLGVGSIALLIGFFVFVIVLIIAIGVYLGKKDKIEVSK